MGKNDRPSKELATRRSGPAVRAALGIGILVALVVGLARPARAWGRLGHRSSARLAESRLSPRARAIVADLLEPGETLADAATWADENSREIPGSAAWHFVNVPISAPRYTAKDCPPQGCVVSKIAEFRAVLADRQAPRARRRQALRFFVHLVQDLHQPMHVADRNDHGGNRLQLRFGRFEATNLHQVWDSGLLRGRYRERDEPELVRDLEALADHPAARAWTRGRIEDWANESLEAGRRAYRVPGTDRLLRPGDAIGRDYADANLPVVLDRLARSGVRLAALLNQILE
ncbi:MAG TPA: S1/P1 nuclease [Isosphaeraceae bacterium]|nr:S1/P1 nuclease [Isosphaeraceae bacterium]